MEKQNLYYVVKIKNLLNLVNSLQLSYALSAYLPISVEEKQNLLEVNIKERLIKLTEIISDQIKKPKIST